MKKLVRLSLALLTVHGACAQAVLPDNIRAQTTLSQLTGVMSTRDFIYGIPPKPPEVIGDTYQTLYWNPTTMMLYDRDRMIEGYPARLDIYRNELEIKAANGVRVMPAVGVKSFVWIDSLTKEPVYFVNARGFKTDDKDGIKGFLQVLADGDVSLLKRTTVYVKKADYNEALSIGTREDKILKKITLYYSKGGQVWELPSSRKKLLATFGTHADAVNAFIEKENLSTSREADLKSIYAFYNSVAASH